MNRPELHTTETIDAIKYKTEYDTKEKIADWLDSISNEWLESELLADMIRRYDWKIPDD